jgi:hypothetical protein
MSDYQFGIYESARQAERKQEKNNAKKRKKQMGSKSVYDDTVSTYRIFSRAFCNFVFPDEMKRPMPNDEEKMEDAVKKLDEDDIDDKGVAERLENPDGRFSTDDVDELKQDAAEHMDASYDERIEDALKFLKDNEDKYLSEEGLETYSPKFLSVLDNIKTTTKDDKANGLHLIYSQFRTLEGIGILKLVLEANGFAQFKIKKDARGIWRINMADTDKGKPTFVLYTGTETAEEKEIMRNIFNSTWEYVPSSIVSELREISTNNFYGEIIKIIMITASGAEGISLKNVRYVHLIEPYWHPVRAEQVIGRARRICSHQDLPEDMRKVEVSLYLMTFTEEQKTGDASIELRLKDVSKIDKSTPLTSDEALHEISTIKEEINKQLLRSVKESSIDCELHSKAGSKEDLVCLSFGDDVKKDKMSYTPSYRNQSKDVETAFNKTTITWKAITLKLGPKKYKLRLQPDGKTRTDMVYDFDSFERAKKVPGVNPVLIGHLKIEGKKAKIVNADA